MANEGKAMDAALDTISKQKTRIDEQVVLIAMLEAEVARLEVRERTDNNNV